MRKRWTDTELQSALAAVRSGQSVSSVSKESGIPKTTLLYKHNGKLPMGKSVGPGSILSSEEKNVLVRWILHLSSRGFPVTKSLLLWNVAYLI